MAPQLFGAIYHLKSIAMDNRRPLQSILEGTLFVLVMKDLYSKIVRVEPFSKLTALQIVSLVIGTPEFPSEIRTKELTEHGT